MKKIPKKSHTIFDYNSSRQITCSTNMREKWINIDSQMAAPAASDDKRAKQEAPDGHSRFSPCF